MKKTFIIIVGLLIVSCSKNAPNLMELAQSSLDQNDEDSAIKNLDLLINKFPEDSLASLAQYKLVNIYKNWKHDPEMVSNALDKTVNNYPGTIQAKQAAKEIAGFPEWIINKAETLRKRKLTKESINNLSYMVTNYADNLLAAKAQYIIGDIYMNDLRDFEKALDVAKQTSSGNIYINRDIVGAVVETQPFGGKNLSGSGFKAGGPNYLSQFMDERVITVNTVAIGGNIDLINLNNDNEH